MDFDSAVKTINKLLREKRPVTFNSSWIRKHALHVYQYIQKNVRAEIGGIDRDSVTRALNRKYHTKWKPSCRTYAVAYTEKAEVNLILNKYKANLHAFISPADKNDEHVRDLISIAVVRIAQKVNVLAREEIVNLIRFTIIEKRIEACMRCYPIFRDIYATRLLYIDDKYLMSGSVYP